MKYILMALLAALYVFSGEAEAACSEQSVNQAGTHIIYIGDCEDDNEVVIQTGDMTGYDACFLMSTTGIVDVLVSLDGTNYSTAPLSMNDYGGTSADPVLVTVALRVYGFASKFRRIRVLQSGATDAAASLLCWSY